MANNVDPDQMQQNAASDQSLLCLLGPVCPNTMSKYDNLIHSIFLVVFSVIIIIIISVTGVW